MGTIGGTTFVKGKYTDCAGSATREYHRDDIIRRINDVSKGDIPLVIGIVHKGHLKLHRIPGAYRRGAGNIDIGNP